MASPSSGSRRSQNTVEPADDWQTGAGCQDWLLSISPTLMFARWQRELAANGDSPGAAEVQKVRRPIMVHAHILSFIPLAAVFLVRGFG